MSCGGRGAEVLVGAQSELLIASGRFLLLRKGQKRWAMSDLDALMSQLRAEAAARGAGWLQATVSDLLQEPSQASPISSTGPSHGRTRASRSRPPQRFSPEAASGVLSCSGSPSKDPPTPPAKQTPASPSVRVGEESPSTADPGWGLYV